MVPTAAPAKHLPMCGDAPVGISAITVSVAASITRRTLAPAVVT